VVILRSRERYGLSVNRELKRNTVAALGFGAGMCTTADSKSTGMGKCKPKNSFHPWHVCAQGIYL